MRTSAEIAEHYRRTRDDDFLGFAAGVLLAYLTAEEFREFAKPDADLSDWIARPLEREAVIAEMRDYMEFAWGKVRDHRGISAKRSRDKMGAWLFVLGDDELREVVERGAYAQYGAPALKAVCDKYGFPVPEGEDIARMMRGLPCRPGCEEGCGQ